MRTISKLEREAIALKRRIDKEENKILVMQITIGDRERKLREMKRRLREEYNHV